MNLWKTNSRIVLLNMCSEVRRPGFFAIVKRRKVSRFTFILSNFLNVNTVFITLTKIKISKKRIFPENCSKGSCRPVLKSLPRPVQQDKWAAADCVHILRRSQRIEHKYIESRTGTAGRTKNIENILFN